MLVYESVSISLVDNTLIMFLIEILFYFFKLKPLKVWAENLPIIIVLLISLFLSYSNFAGLLSWAWSVLFSLVLSSSRRTYSLSCSHICDCFLLLCRIPVRIVSADLVDMNRYSLCSLGRTLGRFNHLLFIGTHITLFETNFDCPKIKVQKQKI